MLFAQDLRNHPPEFRFIEFFVSLADLDRRWGRFFAPAFGYGEQELQELLLHPWPDPRDHPEIDQRETVIVREEDIAGMRICMKKSVHQNLLKIGTEKLLGQGAPSNSIRASGFIAVIFAPFTYSIVRTRAPP